MDNFILNQWFDESLPGCYLKQRELEFYRRALGELSGENMVQMGMSSWPLLSFCNAKMLILQNTHQNGGNVLMQPEALAWAPDSLAGLILPHVLCCSRQPDKVLAEAYHALQPQGKLVLTEFNPHSLWGLAKAFDGKRLPEKKNCLALPQLRHKATALGFTVQRGQFMAYAPFVKKAQKGIRNWSFMEAAGNRWWPHAAAAYGLVLVKQVAAVRPLLEVEQVATPGGMVLGMARAKG